MCSDSISAKYNFPNWVHMHFLSREIIFHVRCRWWCFLHSFRRNKGHIFQLITQAWHRNEAPKSAIWFGSSTYRWHRYHIGTGFRYPTLVPVQKNTGSRLGTHPYTWLSICFCVAVLTLIRADKFLCSAVSAVLFRFCRIHIINLSNSLYHFIKENCCINYCYRFITQH